MTDRKSWPEIFQSAHKHPELRVYRWKDYKRHAELKVPFTQFMHKLGKPGVVHVIVMSDDLVWAVSKLSIELDPTFLFEQTLAARMPFTNVLFEWNGQRRKEAYDDLRVRQEINYDHPEAEHPAILVVDTDGRKNVYSFSYDDLDKKLVMFPLVVELNRPTEDRFHNSFSRLLRETGCQNNIADWLYSSAITTKHPELDALDNDERIHVRMTGPMYGSALQIKDPRDRIQWLMAGTAGQFRWFGALCALLNRPAHIRYVDAGPAAIGDNQPPRKPQTAADRPQVLTLMLPRDKVVQRVLRAAEHERKKTGLHEVMGHWASRHNSGQADCHHVWPVQPTRRQVCETCGKVRWWKEPHRRGEGETMKVKQRRADYSGVTVERLAEAIKQGN